MKNNESEDFFRVEGYTFCLRKLKRNMDTGWLCPNFFSQKECPCMIGMELEQKGFGMEYKYMCGGSSQYFSFDMFLGHWDLFKKGQNKTVIVPMPGIMLITYLCTLLLRKPRALLRVVSTQCNANEIVGRKWKGFPVICFSFFLATDTSRENEYCPRNEKRQLIYEQCLQHSVSTIWLSDYFYA